MKMISYLFILNTIIVLVMMTLLNFISKKSFYDREKMSPFECGFDPKNSARMPFSLHFFLIAVIFLIFDVEIVLLLPLILTLNVSNIFNYSMITLMFSIILLIGLIHEWSQGALKWTL